MCSLHFYFPCVNLNPLSPVWKFFAYETVNSYFLPKKNYRGFVCASVWVRECDGVKVGVSLCGRESEMRGIMVPVCVRVCVYVGNLPTLSSRASPDRCCSTHR